MPYLVSIAGLVTMAFFVVGTFGANLKYMHARMMVVNLLRTDPYRVGTVSRTMQGTFFEGIKAALETGGMMGTRDPAVVIQATRPSYDAATSAAIQKWNMTFSKAKLAAMAAGGALALPMTQGNTPPVLVIIFALLTLAGFGWIWLRRHEVQTAIIKARAEVLPEVDRAIVDGRYVAPPKPQ